MFKKIIKVLYKIMLHAIWLDDLKVPTVYDSQSLDNKQVIWQSTVIC